MSDPNVQPPQDGQQPPMGGQQPQGYPQQPQGFGTPQPAATPAAPFTPEEDKKWASWSHTGGILAFIPALISFVMGTVFYNPVSFLTGAGIFTIFLGFLGLLALILIPVISYTVQGKRGGYTRQEAKEALNFQITYLIISISWGIVAVIISGVLTTMTIGTLGSSYGVLLGWVWVSGIIGLALSGANAWFCFQGYQTVQRQGAYRYPINFRFIK